MCLETQRVLNVAAVILLRATVYSVVKEACLNQNRTQGLNHVEPNPRRICVEKIGIAASHDLIGLVTRDINQPCSLKEFREMRGRSVVPAIRSSPIEERLIEPLKIGGRVRLPACFVEVVVQDDDVAFRLRRILHLDKRPFRLADPLDCPRGCNDVEIAVDLLLTSSVRISALSKRRFPIPRCS
jgi:hypothetical protein